MIDPATPVRKAARTSVAAGARATRRSVGTGLSRFRAERGGATALMFALLTPLVLLFTMGAVNVTEINTAKSQLQAATDAAALTASASVAENPNATEASIQTAAQNMLAADFPDTSVKITDFHVCTPIQNDCTTGAGQVMTENTVAISTSATAPCPVPAILPGVCTGNGRSLPILAANVTNIGIPSNIQISLLLDTSGSMIVGATPADVNAVINWNNVSANWATVHNTSDSNQSTPCAFACHDRGPSSSGVNGPTTSGSANSDMQQGLSNAHSAGATTRFDVMISAVNQLFGHIQTKVTQNSQLAKNNYYFNVSSMADSVSNVYTATTPNDWSDPVTALNKVYVGLDTHLSSDLQTFANTVGKGGTGATAQSPLKFVIIVTDGLQSDFYSDFYSCGGYTRDTAWSSQASQSPGWYGYYEYGCYAAPTPTAQCAAMKANGVIVAVLETPYVPLTGQDPNEQYLYESFVRHTIYPNGPNTASTVSTALQSCASPGYYFQASTTDQSSITTGFVTLTDKYLASNAYIRQ